MSGVKNWAGWKGGTSFECCHDCQKRRVGCHGDCPDYLAEKGRHDAVRAKREAARSEAQEIYDFRAKNINKAITKINKAGKRRRGW